MESTTATERLTLRVLRLGYGRVSTDRSEGREQTLDQQLAKLAEHGLTEDCTYSEKISGSINLKRGGRWKALAARATEALESEEVEEVEIAIVEWSRLSRHFEDFIAEVSSLARIGCVFTVAGDPKYQRWAPRDSMDMFQLAMEAFGAQYQREKIARATKAKLDYLKSQGVKLGRPEKLTDMDCARIDRLAQVSGYNPRLIAEELTELRIAVIPEDLKQRAETGEDDEDVEKYQKALKHAKVSRDIVYRYFTLYGLSRMDFIALDRLAGEYDDLDLIASELTDLRVAAIPEDLKTRAERDGASKAIETARSDYAKALKAARVIRPTVYRYLNNRPAEEVIVA
ncbi:MAG: recombinase family protein [Leucobacter sp.]